MTIDPSRFRRDATGPVREIGSGSRGALVVVLLAAVFATGVGCTWAYREMSALVGVGGACASGGPYVSAQPCPQGTWTITVGV